MKMVMVMVIVQVGDAFHTRTITITRHTRTITMTIFSRALE